MNFGSGVFRVIKQSNRLFCSVSQEYSIHEISTSRLEGLRRKLQEDEQQKQQQQPTIFGDRIKNVKGMLKSD